MLRLIQNFWSYAFAALSLGIFGQQARAAADWDYAADLSGRTYAAGLSLEPSLGLHQLVWGDPTTHFFGYVRPSLVATITPTLFSGKTAIDIYPVSFLGMTLAKTWSHRYLEATGYDCIANTCLGQLNDTEVTFRLLAGYETYFASAQYQRLFYDANSEGDLNIMDPGNALIYRADGSNLNNTAIIIGKKISDKVSAGIIAQRGDLDGHLRASEADYMFARSDLASLGYPMVSATLGLGRFNTEIKRPGISALAILTYTGRPKLGPTL